MDKVYEENTSYNERDHELVQNKIKTMINKGFKNSDVYKKPPVIKSREFLCLVIISFILQYTLYVHRK
jgi:hypothetical protein